MNYSIERPQALYALLLLIPAVAYVVVRYVNLIKTFTEHKDSMKYIGNISSLNKRFIFRTVFRVLSAISLVLAVAKISWGTNTVAVQKSGRAVSMVFDISYSMEANDCYNGKSRLSEAQAFANRLLDKMPNTSVSVVLVKGGATVAIPLTEDLESVRILLSNLSPKLMTAQGSSLGTGITAAINSFPTQSSETSIIWLFTDGEETDDGLTQALVSANKYGIPVGIIGFGNTFRESEIYSGDGVTKVHTALREQKINECIDAALKKNNASRLNSRLPSISYVNYSETGSAYKLLKMLNIDVTKPGIQPSETTNIAFEVQLVNRQGIFIILTIIFFVISYVASELDINTRKLRSIKTGAVLLCCSMLFTGCNERMSDGKKILEGSLEWNRKNYQNAVADFLEAYTSANIRGDEEICDYAIYGLASTYLMQNESQAAMDRYAEISDNASKAVQFSVLYNSGIIAHRNGDYVTAAEYFKKALLVDSTNTNAKINLELSLQEESVHTSSQEQTMNPVSGNGDSGYENSIYSVIREIEQQQWQNKQQTSDESGLDY